MSVSSDWCTKKQAAKLIDRTERTVSRIVREAVEKRTADILDKLKLVYADGREISGADVTIELLAKNEEEGSRTRWFFRRMWWQDEFAPRLNEISSADTGSTDAGPVTPKATAERGVGESLGSPPLLPADPTVRAIVLEHLHYNDRKYAADIRQLTDRVLQVVETNQQLQGQTNTLYNQFQEALKQSGGLKALVGGTATLQAESTTRERSIDRDANVVVIDPEPRDESRPAARASKRTRPKQKASTGQPDETNDWFPTFRGLARYFTRK